MAPLIFFVSNLGSRVASLVAIVSTRLRVSTARFAIVREFAPPAPENRLLRPYLAPKTTETSKNAIKTLGVG
jgi:hypothetical protein